MEKITDFPLNTGNLFHHVFVFFFLRIFYSSCRNSTVSRSTEFAKPSDPDTLLEDTWKAVNYGLNTGIGSVDKRYSRSAPPSSQILKEWQGMAWSGERVNIQLVLWSAHNFKNVDLIKFPNNREYIFPPTVRFL